MSIEKDEVEEEPFLETSSKEFAEFLRDYDRGEHPDREIQYKPLKDELVDLDE